MATLKHYCYSDGPWVDCEPTRLLLITAKVNNRIRLDWIMDTNTIVTDLKPTIDVHICLPIKNTHLATTVFVYALYNVNSCIQGSEKSQLLPAK